MGAPTFLHEKVFIKFGRICLSSRANPDTEGKDQGSL
jgi:hypothetical protein